MNKKIMILLAALAAGVCQGENKFINPIGSGVGGWAVKSPQGWRFEGQQSDNMNAKLQTDSNGKVTAVVMAPVASRQSLYLVKALPFAKGKVFTLKCKVIGNGVVRLGYYAYGDFNKYLFFAARNFTLTGEEQLIKAVYTVKDGKEETVAIRPGLYVLQNSKVQLLDFTCEEGRK